MAKDRPHRDKHDEDLVKMAEQGTREDLEAAKAEALARDDERNQK